VIWNEQGLLAAGEARLFPGKGMIFAWSVESGKPFFALGPVDDPSTALPRGVEPVAPADRPEELKTGATLAMTWTHDARSLATFVLPSSSGARIDLWEAATGRRTQSFSADKSVVVAVALAWSPDGRRLACAVSEQTRVYSRVLPQESVVLRSWMNSSQLPDKTYLAWSADSRNLAVLHCRWAEEAVELSVWDIETAKERFRRRPPYQVLEPAREPIAPIAFSPDGRRLACCGTKAVVLDVATGREERLLSAQGATVTDVAWSPDGRRVIGRNEIRGADRKTDEMRHWDAETGQEVLLLRNTKAAYSVAPGFRGIASTPDFKVSPPGDVVVWDLGAGNSP
jgi:WD40 repeat protein